MPLPKVVLFATGGTIVSSGASATQMTGYSGLMSFVPDADTLIADLDRALCAMPERKAPGTV